jgi:uncharacterized membrane protein
MNINSNQSSSIDDIADAELTIHSSDESEDENGGSVADNKRPKRSSKYSRKDSHLKKTDQKINIKQNNNIVEARIESPPSLPTRPPPINPMYTNNNNNNNSDNKKIPFPIKTSSSSSSLPSPSSPPLPLLSPSPANFTYDKNKQPAKSSLKKAVKWKDETEEHPFNNNIGFNENQKDKQKYTEQKQAQGNVSTNTGTNTTGRERENNMISQIIEFHQNENNDLNNDLDSSNNELKEVIVTTLSPSPATPGGLINNNHEKNEIATIKLRDNQNLKNVLTPLQKLRNPQKAKTYIITSFGSVLFSFFVAIWAFIVTKDMIVYIPCIIIILTAIVYIYSATWNSKNILNNVYGTDKITEKTVDIYREFSTQFNKLRVRISYLTSIHLVIFFVVFMNININLKDPQYNPTGYIDTFPYLTASGKAIFILLILNLFFGFSALQLTEKETKKLYEWYNYKMIITQEILNDMRKSI